MNLKEINSLVELFFKKYEEKFPTGIKGMNSHEETFLVSLKNKDFSDTNSGPFTYSWSNIYSKVKILSCLSFNSFINQDIHIEGIKNIDD